MKDYKLSEIKKICQGYEYCSSCPLDNFCKNSLIDAPEDWTIGEKNNAEMTVYCVMEIKNYEYGCRDVESVWTTYEQAKAHIKELGNVVVTFWDGSTEDKYTINFYIVKELKENK